MNHESPASDKRIRGHSEDASGTVTPVSGCVFRKCKARDTFPDGLITALGNVTPLLSPGDLFLIARSASEAAGEGALADAAQRIHEAGFLAGITLPRIEKDSGPLAGRMLEKIAEALLHGYGYDFLAADTRLLFREGLPQEDLMALRRGAGNKKLILTNTPLSVAALYADYYAPCPDPMPCWHRTAGIRARVGLRGVTAKEAVKITMACAAIPGKGPGLMGPVFYLSRKGTGLSFAKRNQLAGTAATYGQMFLFGDTETRYNEEDRQRYAAFRRSWEMHRRSGKEET